MPTISKLKMVNKAAAAFHGSMEKCAICPRKCQANRHSGRPGYCRAPVNPVVYSYSPHHGEEPPLSGSRGSGTIFFSGCNMKCVYCQNYCFSQLDAGNEISCEKLAGMMLSLQENGCHNINLVNPTHFVPQVLASLEIAIKLGLTLPVVSNTSGYDHIDTIKALEGIVDIYLPDMRYSDNKMARLYSDAPDYVEQNRRAVLEMQRQVGCLRLDPEKKAKRGLIIRLLALPGNASGTIATLKFIADEIGRDTHLSIMSQYYPTFKALDHNEISRGITPAEYKNIVDAAKELGLNNGWVQEGPTGADPKFLGTNIPPKV